MVTSGVVPGLIIYKMLSDIQENQAQYTLTEETYYMGVVPYLGFSNHFRFLLSFGKF